MIRVVVADDHPKVRAAVCALVARQGDMEVVGQAEDGVVCLELVRSLGPDAIVLDLEMPRCSGLEVLQALREDEAAPTIVVYTMHGVPAYVHRCLALGALGFVSKDEDGDELLAALRDAVEGRRYVGHSLAASV